MEEALADALDRDVEVEIITARKRDQPVYKDFLNSDLFHDVLSKGAKVFEEPYKYLHMKAYQVDDTYLSIGSFNQDVTSFYCNNETNITLESVDSAHPSIKEFDTVFKNLRNESSVVDPNEKYTPVNWVKSKFWKLWIEGTYFLMKNRNRN